MAGYVEHHPNRRDGIMHPRHALYAAAMFLDNNPGLPEPGYVSVSTYKWEGAQNDAKVAFQFNDVLDVKRWADRFGVYPHRSESAESIIYKATVPQDGTYNMSYEFYVVIYARDMVGKV